MTARVIRLLEIPDFTTSKSRLSAGGFQGDSGGVLAATQSLQVAVFFQR
jgi:hypothetical protein